MVTSCKTRVQYYIRILTSTQPSYGTFLSQPRPLGLPFDSPVYSPIPHALSLPSHLSPLISGNYTSILHFSDLGISRRSLNGVIQYVSPRDWLFPFRRVPGDPSTLLCVSILYSVLLMSSIPWHGYTVA